MRQELVPLVSVVIPTFNRSGRLMRCLNSLQRQTFPSSDFEIIVADDGSTDGTREKIQELKTEGRDSFTYIRGPHLGPARARNLGIEASRAEIVAFIDDDCTADPDWLQSLLRPFASLDVGGVEGRVISRGQASPLSRSVSNRSGGQYLTANAAYRRNVLERVGGFDETFLLAGGEDYDLAYRVLKGGYRIVFEDNAVTVHPVYYQSFHEFSMRLRTWWSTVKLSKKHPRMFAEHVGRSGTANTVFYLAVYPILELIRWRNWFWTNPADLPFFVVRMAYQAFYGVFILLRTIVGLLPREVYLVGPPS